VEIQEAEEILKDYIDDWGLGSFDHYIDWHKSDITVVLDGRFTAKQLEAIAVWMQNHSNIK